MEKYGFIILFSIFVATTAIQPSPDDGLLQERWPRWMQILEIVGPILTSLIAIIKSIYYIMRCLRRRRGEEPAAAEQGPQSGTARASVELPARSESESFYSTASSCSRASFRGENGEEAESTDHHPQALQSVTSQAPVELKEIVVDNSATRASICWSKHPINASIVVHHPNPEKTTRCVLPGQEQSTAVSVVRIS